MIYFDFEFYEVITPEYQKEAFCHRLQLGCPQQSDNFRYTEGSRHPRTTGILDFERGREDAITPYPWLDDTATGPWFYVAAEKIKTPQYVIGILADIVAKNGCMLLDIGPKVDGTLPDESVNLLLKLGNGSR